MTMLPVGVVFFVRQLLASDRHHVQGMMTVFIVMFFASFLSACIGPTEGYTRYRMSFDSAIEVNILKSMVHIFGFYLAALVLAFRVPAYIRSIRKAWRPSLRATAPCVIDKPPRYPAHRAVPYRMRAAACRHASRRGTQSRQSAWAEPIRGSSVAPQI